MYYNHYYDQHMSPGMGMNHPKMMNQGMYPVQRPMQGGIPEHGLNHHESIPIYQRPMYPGSPLYSDPSYAQGKYGHYVGPVYASPGHDPMGIDRSAHRNRVMSEQQINTYKPFQ